MTDDVIIHSYQINGDGSGTPLSSKEIENRTPEKGLAWVHLDSSKEAASEWLMKYLSVSPETCEALFDQATRPRNIMMKEGFLVILRGVNCNPGQDPEDMVAIRMLFCEHIIISSRNRRVMAVQEIQQMLDTGKGPCSKGEFLLMVAEKMTDRMGDVIQELEESMDDLETQVVNTDSHELLPKLADTRRVAISLRRYIAPQRDSLSRLILEKLPWFQDSDRMMLRGVAERTARFVEDIDSAKERAIISQEEIRSQLSEKMNKAMYTLAIITAVFLPLGLLTGLLGINVGGIPGTEFRWAFTIVALGILGIAVALVIWFKKIRWL